MRRGSMADRPVRSGGPSAPGGGAGQGAAPLRMLQDRTQQFLQARLTALFKQVWNEFFELADNTDSIALQTQYLDTMKAMRLDKGAIESAFLKAVSADYDALLSLDDTTDTTPFNSHGVGGLKLVGNEELEEIIAFDAIVSRNQARCAPLLNRFARRVAYVLQRSFKVRDMPIYPERLCDAFIKAVRPVAGGSQALIALLKVFDRCVLADLEGFLNQSNDLLKGLGILPGLEDEKVRNKDKSAVHSKNGARQKPPPPRRRLSDLIDESVEQPSAQAGRPAGARPQRSSAEQSALVEPQGWAGQSTQRSRQHAARLGTVSQLLSNLQANKSPSASYPNSGTRAAPGTIAAGGAAALLDVLTEIRSLGPKSPQTQDVPAGSGAVRVGVRRQVEEHLASQGRAFSDLHPIDQTALELLDLLFAQWQQRDWVPGVLGE